jgi:hypothetical protein
MSEVHKANFNQAYRRYTGPLARELSAKLGMNQSTHVAQVCLDPTKPDLSELAVVKHFHYTDKGWANEYIAWTLAQELGVKTAPRAALLMGNHADVTPDHGPELGAAIKYVKQPFVLWCTSAVNPVKPLQQVYGHSWENAVLRGDSGRIMGALDGWTANCDRIFQNALYWTTHGTLVAIDHEKLAFNKDWTTYAVDHDDEKLDASGKPLEKTRLIAALMIARSSQDKSVKKNAKTAANAMYEHSKTEHPRALKNCKKLIKDMVDKNFSTQATKNLISFLDYRLKEDCLRKRFGVLA